MDPDRPVRPQWPVRHNCWSHAARFQDYLSRWIERPPEMDAYVPFRSNLAGSPADQSYLRVVGRLRDGVTIAQRSRKWIRSPTDSREYNTFATRRSRLQVSRFKGTWFETSVPRYSRSLAEPVLRAAHCLRECCHLLLVRANERDAGDALRTGAGAGRGPI